MDSRFSSSRINVLILACLRAESQIVHDEADQSANHGGVAKPLQRPFPQLHRPWDARIFRQPAVNLRLGSVVQNVNHSSAANAWWIVHARIRKVGVIAKMFGAAFSKELHIFLAAEVQAACRALLDACRFRRFATSTRAQRALENAMGLRVHLWNVERASRDAVAAADAIGLLKIDDAIRVLHDGS